jgi:hypothetical protein
MKNYLLLLFAFLLLAGCKEAKKNEVAPVDPTAPLLAPPPPTLVRENVTIEVMIVREIPDNITQDEIVNYIQLYVANQNGKYGSILGNPSEFTVDVFSNFWVKWKGKKLNGIPGANPKIDSIKMKDRAGNVNILDGNGRRTGPNNNDLEFDVLNSGVQEDSKEYYNIFIKVRIGNEWKQFTIDPVLKYH